ELVRPDRPAHLLAIGDGCPLAKTTQLGYLKTILANCQSLRPCEESSPAPEIVRMNPRRLFVASCIALVASAFSFIFRQDVLPAWGRSFDLNAKELGWIGGIAFWGMATAMAIGSFIVDALGMKKML